MTRTTLAVAILTALTVSVTVSAQQRRKPVNMKGELPAPFATPSVRNSATVVPKPDGATLSAPAGFVVEEFMDFAGLRPRFMMLGPSNEILISDTSGNGNVFVVNNGVRTAIIEKLDRPYGLAMKGDQLYVAEPTSIKQYTYDAKTMRVTSPGKEIIALPGMGTGLGGVDPSDAARAIVDELRAHRQPKPGTVYLVDLNEEILFCLEEALRVATG